MVSIASNWAGDAGRDDKAKTDKIPLHERFEWALDNEEILLSYAESPKVNQGWMKADKPWQFIAACFELMKFRVWQGERNDFDDYSFESSLECYIDGSNNGSQHLSALTKDEITAPHVNLVPLDLPGDLYNYIAVHCWDRIKTMLDGLEPDDVNALKVYVDTLIDLKKQIAAAEPKSEVRAQAVERVKEFKLAHESLANRASIVFWSKITDLKQRRKVVKRNVMTLPYGGTSYGLG